MALTDQQKIDIRRHLGYPAYGGNTTQAFGWRYFQWYGTLEYRMNNLGPDEVTTVNGVYLTNLSTLESAIVGASANLDTDAAAVWKHNKNEVQDRKGLYDMWRQRLATFFGVPLRDMQSGTVRMVV